MFIGDHLDTGTDEMHIGLAPDKLLFQPLPLVRAKNIGVTTGLVSKIAVIQQDDFHTFARWTKCVRRVHSCLLPARTFRWFIKEIEQKPLTFDFVRIFFAAVAHPIIIIIPSADDTALLT